MSSHVVSATPLSAAAPPAADRTWFDLIGNTPAWLVSAGVHLLILFLLAGVTYSVTIETKPEITSELVEEVDLDQFKFENATVLDEVGNDSPVNIASPSLAAATEAGKQPQEQFEQRLSEEFTLASLPTRDLIPQPNQLELTSAVDVNGTTETVGGVEGAIDILTQEVASSLRENETTVIWLFDSSLSMKARRDAVADRFENIYRQLGEMGVLGETPGRLQTIAASYGTKWNLLTEEPATDVGPVAEKIRQIDTDGTPAENVFGAIDAVTNRFLHHRTKQRRNMLVVVVTDERGDDFQNLESLINRLKRYGIRVYCSGNAAPFGRAKGLLPWTYPDGFVSMEPVDQGPETVSPELLALPFWGRGGPDIISSGYGPYAMTRLCAETGGLYLITEDGYKNFDPAVMRNYGPDYRPIAMYEADLRKNLAKQALVKAAAITQQPDRENAIPIPLLTFPAENDTVLRTAVTEAQKRMAPAEYAVTDILTLLEQGERDRAKLDTPRWRAAFDLAYGRVLALKARAFGYNQMLADMKVQPKTFKDKTNNQWALRPSEELSAGPAVKKIAEKARETLARVIDEHPGTPWADLAARELATPLGWEWKEQNDLVVRFGERARNPEQARLLLAEEEKRQAERRAMPQPKRERPKL